MAAIAVVDMSPDAILVLDLTLHPVRSAGQIYLAFPVAMEKNFGLTVLGYFQAAEALIVYTARALCSLIGKQPVQLNVLPVSQESS